MIALTYNDQMQPYDDNDDVHVATCRKSTLKLAIIGAAFSRAVNFMNLQFLEIYSIQKFDLAKFHHMQCQHNGDA